MTGLPALLPCLAPSHVCPFALPWEEVAGWSWGGAAILTKPPRPFLQRASRAGEGTCRRGCGEWGVRSVRLLCLLPTAPKQGRLHQPLPAESREEVVLSHPGLCHFSETSTPPPPQSRPLGRVQCWRAPKGGGQCRWGDLMGSSPASKGLPLVGDSCLHGLYGGGLGGLRPQSEWSGPQRQRLPLSLSPAQDR